MSKASSLNKPLRLTFGEYRVTLLDTGRFALDGGAMFGVVPRMLWEKLLAPDDQSRVPLALNCLLIEYRDQKLLFETGIGAKFSDKHVDMYGIETYPEHGGKPPIVHALFQAGVLPDDITKVMFSHLHFDHAGGGTMLDAKGNPVPTFKNAEYLVHHGEWESAECPHERCRASYLKENFAPLYEAERLTLLERESTEVLPGLRLRLTGGHTAYHQVLTLDLGDKGGFIFWADLIPTHHHLKIPYVMGYDEYPMATMEAKKELLAEACEKGWVNFFEHDFEWSACYLKATGRPDTYEAQAVRVPVKA